MTRSVEPAATGRALGRRRVRRVGLALATIVAIIVAVPSSRHGALRSLGGVLVVSDAIEPSDVGVIAEAGGTVEFQAAEIELSDLYKRRLVSHVIVMRPSPEEVDAELTRRGVRLEDPAAATLQQLGIPRERIALLESGEGGTTESSHALAAWAREHRDRVIVVIGAAHARRYRRALRRVWPAGALPPITTYPHHTIFRPDDWWQSRRSLREGLFELQKLAWDYVAHPW